MQLRGPTISARIAAHRLSVGGQIDRICQTSIDVPVACHNSQPKAVDPRGINARGDAGALVDEGFNDRSIKEHMES